MLSITMLQQNLQLDEYNCSVQAKVEPSNRIETRTGILVGVNNHFESSLDKESVQDASLVTEVLEVKLEHFNEACSYDSGSNYGTCRGTQK